LKNHGDDPYGKEKEDKLEHGGCSRFFCEKGLLILGSRKVILAGDAHLFSECAAFDMVWSARPNLSITVSQSNKKHIDSPG
jgi:hypothetical protein